MKKFVKVITLMLAVIMLMTLTVGCGGSGNSVEKIQKKGVLTVATSPDFPPFENLENNEIVGIEVEIVKKFAESLGVKVEFVSMDFDSVIPGIQTGKFDLGMSGITITEARKKNSDFTDPYFLAAQSIVVLADSGIKTKADLDGKKISVQTGTTAEEYCMENDYDVSAFAANNDAMSALLTGKVDAYVVDNEVAVALSAEQNGATIVLEEKMTTEPYGFCFAKNSSTLTKAFNDLIKSMIDSGEMEELFNKYEALYVKP